MGVWLVVFVKRGAGGSVMDDAGLVDVWCFGAPRLTNQPTKDAPSNPITMHLHPSLSPSIIGTINRHGRTCHNKQVRDGRGIGPKTVPTREAQMFRFHDDQHPEDRLLISTALTFQGGWVKGVGEGGG